MLSLSQETAIRQWVVDALDDSTLDPVPLERVGWSNQDFPDMAYPYVLLAYTGSAKLGAGVGKLVRDNDDQVTRTDLDTTVSITAVSQRSDTAPSTSQLARAYLRELSARTEAFVARGLIAENLAVRELNLVPDVARLQGRSQWESRAVLDIRFGHAIQVTEQPEVIETAEIDGETVPETPNRTLLVG